jgi:hypothetical protein
VVRVWTFAPDARLRHGDDSYQGYDQHLAVVTGKGWVVGDDVARRAVQPGDVMVCPSGGRLVVGTDAALCLLAVSRDIDEEEESRRRSQRRRLRVVEDALAGERRLSMSARATVLARVATPQGVTVDVWSIAAGGVVRHQTDRPTATDLSIPVVDQTNFIVIEGSGWVDGDTSPRQRITPGHRVLVPTPRSARIGADTALTLVVVSGVW